MATLEYHWEDGTHTVFHDYTIDKLGVIRNKKRHVMAQNKTNNGYYRVTLTHEGIKRCIFVHRAIASTFIGPPPTLEHTAEHKYRNRADNTFNNVLWLDKSGQANNRDMPKEYKSAFIIEKDDVELTAKDWVKVYKKPDGTEYATDTIKEFARQQKYGFRYKVFPNLRREVWKAVPDSKNSQGEWFISNKNRMKYKTVHAENVLTMDQLHKDGGYPMIVINGNNWKCHHLSMMTFRPREYVAKLPGDIMLHKNDNMLDFNPFRLRWGTHSENGIDAHRNGKYDGTKSTQKLVVSYINGELEKKHESLSDAAKYLREIGYPDAKHQAVSRAAKNNVAKYDRTWAF